MNQSKGSAFQEPPNQQLIKHYTTTVDGILASCWVHLDLKITGIVAVYEGTILAEDTVKHLGLGDELLASYLATKAPEIGDSYTDGYNEHRITAVGKHTIMLDGKFRSRLFT